MKMNSVDMPKINQNTTFENWDSSKVDLFKNNRKSVLIFTSLYCVVCVDLLPDLKQLSSEFDANWVLFSNGTLEDHEEMVAYFEWEFPVVRLNPPEMETYFDVKGTPSLIVLESDGTVLVNEIVKTKEDIVRILSKFGIQS